MRLNAIQNCLRQKGMPYQYVEDNDSGSITFTHRGLHYHIWEFPAPDRGAESNLRSAGRSEDYEGDYEAQLLALLREF